MKARDGVNFLTVLLVQDLMDADDLEEAIRIAGEREPSGAFKAAQIYFIGKHGPSVFDGYLAFAKGTRWLAVLRRDEGEEVFKETAEGIRRTAKAFAKATKI